MLSCGCMLKLSVRKLSFLGFYEVICATALRPTSFAPFRLLTLRLISSLAIEDKQLIVLTPQFSHCLIHHLIHLRGH